MSKWLVTYADEYGDERFEVFITEDAAVARAKELAELGYRDVAVWRRHASAKSQVVVEIEKED